MSKPSQVPSQEQLLLFQPPPTRPSWKTLPAEVREQVIHLLAQMLCERRMWAAPTLVDQETADE